MRANAPLATAPFPPERGALAAVAEVEWLRSRELVDYERASRFMQQRAAAIAGGRAAAAVWLLEHPPIYTCGTSARNEELLDRLRFPVYRTGRGGRITYHGPGQRVGYVMLDLRRRGADVRAFVAALEDWLIAALAALGVAARRSEGRIGIWVDLPGGGEAKIGAIGVRIRHWVSFHGFALNVAPDLSHFGGIIPCGLAGSAVTSLAALDNAATMADLDQALRTTFAQVWA
ncbi:MAG: lipoyl(octanoyl) transferase LipB [Rhodospirillales bacterium]